MKMKSIVKLLEAQGFITEVHSSIIKKTGFTTCRKQYIDNGYAISVTAYNDGGFIISKYEIKEWDGKILATTNKPYETVHFETLKELKDNFQNTINEWTS